MHVCMAQHRRTCLTTCGRHQRSSMSPLCWHHDTTSAVYSSGYHWWPRLSGGCSTCMEQSTTRDSGLLLTFDIPEGDQVSPLSWVIWLTWRRLLRWSADVCIELCNSIISRFCKVTPQLCDDGSTVINDICSSSSSSSSRVVLLCTAFNSIVCFTVTRSQQVTTVISAVTLHAECRFNQDSQF